MRALKTAVIIPAAGTSSRMGADKQRLLLDGKPVLAHTLEAFNSHEGIDEIILVGKDKEIAKGFSKVSTIVEGGENRQSSVWAGLCALRRRDGDIDRVLVHDGARPLVSHSIISDVLQKMLKSGCAVSGVRSKDTIKITDADNIVMDTPARENMWLVQTPQAFPYSILVEAHKKAIADGFEGTDDAVLVERMGIPVEMVEACYSNIKLTTAEDLLIAEAYIKQRNT